MPETIKTYGQYQNEVMQDGAVATGAMTEKIPMEAAKPPVQVGGSAEDMAESEKKNADFESLSDEEKKKRIWG